MTLEILVPTTIDNPEELQTNSVTKQQELEMTSAILRILSDISDDEEMSTSTQADTQPANELIDFCMFLMVLPELSIPFTLTIEEMFQPDGGSQPVPVSLNEMISNLPLKATLQETTRPSNSLSLQL